VTITANNGIAPNATQNFTLNITCPTINVTSAPAAGNLNLIFNTAMTTNTYSQANGNGTIGWTITGQPTGLSIGGANGQLTGTPTVTGTFNATVTATDAGGCTGTKAVTITVAPVAVNDTYNSTFGLSDNTQFVITGGMTGTPGTPVVTASANILTNDLPNGGVAATPGTFATSAGGSVTIAADGTFVYTPKANPSAAATTSDSFTYTVVSNGVTSAPGTVSLALAGRVWYVKSGGSDSNTGQSQAPFLTLGKAASVSTSNDTIFLYSGNDANLGAASLKQGQSLIGQGVALVVNSRTLVSAGTFPTLGGTLTASSINGLTVNGVSMSTSGTPAVTFTNAGGTFTFQAISSNGAGNGVSLVNTTGSFTVTGNGGSCDATTTTCTGGRIQNTTGADFNSPAPANTNEPGVGIYMNSAQNVSLTRMHLNDHSNFAAYGVNVAGFTMDTSLIDGVNGTNVTTPVNDGSVTFLGLTGTSSITNSTIKGGRQRNVNITNSSGTANITISGNTIRDTSALAGGDDNLFIQADTTATITAHVTGNTFKNSYGDHFQSVAQDSATMTLVFTGNFFSAADAAWTVAGGGQGVLGGGVTISGGAAGSTEHMNFNISNNGSSGSPLTGTVGGGVLNINQGTGGGTWQGQVSGNWIGDPATANSGATSSGGIRVENHSVSGTMKAIVGGPTAAAGNHIRQWNSGPGINFQIGDTGNLNSTIDLTVMNNVVSNPGASSQHGVVGNFGADTAGSNAVCADINTNNIDLGASPPNGGSNIRLRQRNSSTVKLPGYAGANTNTAAVISFESGQNTLNPSGNVTASTAVPPGGGFVGGGACAQPTVPN
jgi:hypothetical protein